MLTTNGSNDAPSRLMVGSLRREVLMRSSSFGRQVARRAKPQSSSPIALEPRLTRAAPSATVIDGLSFVGEALAGIPKRWGHWDYPVPSFSSDGTRIVTVAGLKSKLQIWGIPFLNSSSEPVSGTAPHYAIRLAHGSFVWLVCRHVVAVDARSRDPKYKVLVRRFLSRWLQSCCCRDVT